MGKIRGVSDEFLRGRISEALTTFSLEEKTDAAVGTLSKGMKQKVALIAATLHEPGVLVLDEPLTALDPRTQVFVNGWISFSEGEGHDGLLLPTTWGIAQDHATQIAIIDKGR